MARKTSDAEIPNAGGSYIRRKDGGLDVVHATEQLAQVPVAQAGQVDQAPAEAAPPQTSSEES